MFVEFCQNILYEQEQRPGPVEGNVSPGIEELHVSQAVELAQVPQVNGH